MADLSSEVAAFLSDRAKLLSRIGAQWVVYKGGVCRGHFTEFEDAARYALDNFRDQPFLIRHTEDAQPVLPMLVVAADRS